MGFLDDTLRQLQQNGDVPQPLIVVFRELLAGNATDSNAQELQPASQPDAPQAQPSPLPVPGDIPAPPAGNAASQNDIPDLNAGLGALLEQLQASGLDDVVRSWLGGGENKPVHPEHLGNALGQDKVGQMADKAGCSENDLLSQLARALPGLIDNLTKGGGGGTVPPSPQDISQRFRGQ